ncbi:hypothetical protein PsYK624_070610 [Phanerochaete sordida]|uniref:Uncharacterized protein n=1 Tax=Phanerochaete sordida TaxID=48140 RepID=A0A9P3GBM5_9APHY|nr:hypothetical protein PsYK624_070610 [Phanerochaete sordida]
MPVAQATQARDRCRASGCCSLRRARRYARNLRPLRGGFDLVADVRKPAAALPHPRCSPGMPGGDDEQLRASPVAALAAALHAECAKRREGARCSGESHILRSGR